MSKTLKNKSNVLKHFQTKGPNLLAGRKTQKVYLQKLIRYGIQSIKCPYED